MRATRWLSLMAGLLALTGCDRDPLVMTGPVVESLWSGPEIVASSDELTGLAEVATDPFVLGLSAALPGTADAAVVAALERFSAGVLVEPGPSYLSLELDLGSTLVGPTPSLEPDTELAREVVDLYRDYAAATLFGIERDELGPLPRRNGS